MVSTIVDGIDTDDIDAKILELGNIALADGSIGQRVSVGRSTARLVVDTTEVKACFTLPESLGMLARWGET